MKNQAIWITVIVVVALFFAMNYWDFSVRERDARFTRLEEARRVNIQTCSQQVIDNAKEIMGKWCNNNGMPLSNCSPPDSLGKQILSMTNNGVDNCAKLYGKQ